MMAVSVTMILQDLTSFIVQLPDRVVVGGESCVESHVPREVPHVVAGPIIGS